MNKLNVTQKNLLRKYASQGFIPLSVVTKNTKTIKTLEKGKLLKTTGKDDEQVTQITDQGMLAIQTNPESEKVAKYFNTPQKGKIRTGTKQHTIITMLARKNGATLEQLMKATGWIEKSVKSIFTGALKERLNLTVESEERGKKTYYFIRKGLDKVL